MDEITSETGLIALVRLFKKGPPDGKNAIVLISGMNAHNAKRFIETLEKNVTDGVTATNIVDVNIQIEVVYY